jgi:hypothetical protein
MLADFLRAQLARPFVWGESDCATRAADWVRLRTGSDPCAFCRGRYFDAAGAMAFYNLHGGLPRAMGRQLRVLGFRLTRDPRLGDVAAIALPGLVIAAIVGERHYHFWMETGAAMAERVRVRLIAAWAIR